MSELTAQQIEAIRTIIRIEGIPDKRAGEMVIAIQRRLAHPQPKDGDIARWGEQLIDWCGGAWRGWNREALNPQPDLEDIERVVTAEDALAALLAYYEEHKGTETLTHGWSRAVMIVERLIAEAKHGA